MSRPTTAALPARAVVCRPAARSCVAGTSATRRGSAGRSTARGGAVDRAAATAAGRVTAATGRAPRLTTRGRALVVLIIAVVLTVSFSLGRVSSRAAPDAGPPLPRPTVVVQPGETLWQIAERTAPAADPRETVWRIAEINDLGRSPTIHPGQQLILPGPPGGAPD